MLGSSQDELLLWTRSHEMNYSRITPEAGMTCVEAPGDNFPSGRVPGRTSELPRSEIDDDGRDGTFRGRWSFVLGFLRRGEYIGEGWASGASQGRHTLAGRGPTPGRAPMACGPLGGSSVFRKLPDVLFTEEKISPDFDDIFRVGFLKPKTAGNTELALWQIGRAHV